MITAAPAVPPGPPERITALLDFMQWVVIGLAWTVFTVLILSITLRIHKNRQPAPPPSLRDLTAVKWSLPTAQDKQWWEDNVLRPLKETRS